MIAALKFLTSSTKRNETVSNLTQIHCSFTFKKSIQKSKSSFLCSDKTHINTKLNTKLRIVISKTVKHTSTKLHRIHPQRHTDPEMKVSLQLYIYTYERSRIYWRKHSNRRYRKQYESIEQGLMLTCYNP